MQTRDKRSHTVTRSGRLDVKPPNRHTYKENVITKAKCNGSETIHRHTRYTSIPVIMGKRDRVVTKRSLRSADLGLEKRPKRNVQSKTVDDSVGLSRQEEQELNKALYASLNETRRTKSLPSLTGLDNTDFSIQTSSNGSSDSSSRSVSVSDKPSSSRLDNLTLGKRRSLRGGTPLPKRLFRRDSTGSSENDNLNIDESSKDSVKSSSSSGNGSKRKIHAQRKFAQGCSLPGTPVSSPAKANLTPVKLLSRTPKTEDFLTFLCLRGSSALPSHLDFFNFSREELPLRDDSPKTSLAGRRKRTCEPVADENSSSSSGANEIVSVVRTPSSTGKSMTSQSRRSAARASAGTLETARGIVSLRQGLQRKPSPVGAFTPIRSSVPNRHYKSSQKRSGSGGKSSQSSLINAEVVKSARKNLLGKLTSVANKQGDRKSFVGARTKLLSVRDRSIHLQEKSGREGASEHGRERRGLRERKKIDRKKGFDDKDIDEEWEEVQSVSPTKEKIGSKKFKESIRMKRRYKESKTKHKPKRRVSERLKILLQSSPPRRRRRLISEDEDDEPAYEQKLSVKTENENVDMKTSSSLSPTHSLSKKQSQHHSSRKLTQNRIRKPFRVRPPERVRTRGYSLLLASKLALKRAKREKTVINRDVKEEKEIKTEEKDLKLKGELTSISIIPSTSPSGNILSVNVAKRDGDKSKDRVLSSQTAQNCSMEKEGESNVTKRIKGVTQQNKEAKKNLIGASAQTSNQTNVKKVKASTPTSRSSSASSSSPFLSSSKPASSSSSKSSLSASQHELIPTFRPSESEFIDPIAYISKIQPEAEPHGMCKIIPPASWKLDSSKMNEDIRFTPQVQHVHRLFNRWGPNVQKTAAINYHLLSELSANTAPPQIGGVEIDLPRLYSLVEEMGGLSKMADKKSWATIADAMNIPKQAMDRMMRLYDIYCRHVLPYATLSQKEKDELEEEVKAIHELQTLEDDAITRGKSMSVSWFGKIARNVQALWFKDDPTPDQVENEYWRILAQRENHVAVQCGHINTLAQASAFPVRKDNPYSRHQWNLNLIPNHSKCMLKYLGPVPGTTIPTMHMGMLFSTSCWSNDPHGLPYIQYHHTGADIVWYCISKSQRSKFRSAMMEISSSLISNKPRWLKEDCVMVNPALLRYRGLKVGRCVHRSREFVVVFPGAHTATVSCGYSVSESVHYATTKWLPSGMDAAMALMKSGEKELFAMSSLLCPLSQDKDIDLSTLTDALPLLSSIIYKELDLRTQLHAAGLRSEKKMLGQDSPLAGQGGSKKRSSPTEEDKTCEICNRICHLSMVYVEQEEQILCLEHGLRHIQRRKNSKSTRLFVLYNQPELESMLKAAKERLVTLSSPKPLDSGSTSSGSKTRAGGGKQ